MDFPVRKIQILANNNSGHPLFYCHSEDLDHFPTLSLEKVERHVVIRARRMLYKVKFNPQRKNRVDIYMSLTQASDLGKGLISIAQCERATGFRSSTASPGAAAQGNMKLPNIVWSKYGPHQGIKARLDTGTFFPIKESGSIYVDLEFPDESHIKMTEHEIHIGIDLNPPMGEHSLENAHEVNVPESELQRGRNEKNPLHKVHGDIVVIVNEEVAASFGQILQGV